MKKAPKVKAPQEDLPRLPKDAPAPAMPLKSEEDKMRDGEHDLDHLLRAEDIKQDPDRVAYVQKAHQKRMTGMRSLADLKVAGQALADKKKQDLMAGSDGDGDEAIPAQPRHKTRYPAGG